jgi:hypothetical protein
LIRILLVCEVRAIKLGVFKDSAVENLACGGNNIKGRSLGQDISHKRIGLGTLYHFIWQISESPAMLCVVRVNMGR